MKIYRQKKFSNIDWGKVQDDVVNVGGSGLLGTIFGSYYLRKELGLSKKASVIGGLGAGIGTAALIYKLLGHGSYAKDKVIISEEKLNRIEK